MNLIVRAVLSLDHINIVVNSLYIFTSVYKSMSLLEVSLIYLDIFLIAIFQLKIYSVYFKYRGKEVSKIQNQKDLSITLTIFFL